MSNTIALTDWGIKQRNLQWAQRIKAVKDQYDIIIIWGGSLHFDESEYYYALPYLLSSSNGITIDFDVITSRRENGTVYMKRLAEMISEQPIIPLQEIELSEFSTLKWQPKEELWQTKPEMDFSFAAAYQKWQAITKGKTIDATKSHYFKYGTTDTEEITAEEKVLQEFVKKSLGIKHKIETPKKSISVMLE